MRNTRSFNRRRFSGLQPQPFLRAHSVFQIFFFKQERGYECSYTTVG